MQYFFSFTLLFLCFVTFSQENADSLEIEKYRNLGRSAWGARDFHQALNHFEKALELKINLYGEDHFEVSKEYHNFGTVHHKISSRNKSIYYFEKAKDIRIKWLKKEGENLSKEKIAEYKKLTKSTYKNLLSLLEEQGDPDKAILLYQEFTTFIEKDEEKHPELLVQLGQAYVKKEKIHTQKAIEIYKRAITIFRKQKNLKKTASTLYDLGNAYYLINDLDNAEKCYLESFDILYNVIGEYSMDIFNVSNNLGAHYITTKNKEKSNEFLELAIDIANNIFEDDTINFNFAYPYDNLGNLYAIKGDLENELKSYNKALSYFIPKFESYKNDLNNYPLEKFILNGPKSDIIQTLSSRADCLYKLDKKNETLKEYDFIDKVISSLRQDISTSSSNLFWIEKTRKTYKNAISLALELNQKEKAFEFIEKSKSVFLFENLQKSKNINIGELSEELQEKRTNLVSEIQLEEFILSLYPEKNDSLKNELELSKSKLNEFDKTNFQQNLFDINFKGNTLEDFKTYLSHKNSIAIEFFKHDDYLIAAIISSSGINFHTYNKDEKINKNIRKWIQQISIPKSNISKQEIQDINILSHSIYNDLISPLDIPEKENIIIIPDGILQFIPFEALITENNNSSNFSNASYFIKKNQISYAYSASVQLELNLREIINDGSALIMAPQTFNGLAELGIEEAQKIKALTQGELLENDNATSVSFLEKAPFNNLIHLSTHASGGDNKNIQPWIAFKDRKLNLSELYNLQLNTQLVTLSACETAKGEIIEGEGVMSLARGFSFAGVPQVITSMWEVNEKSTTQIMESFYTELMSGTLPSEALHKAKLNYLENNSLAEASPYHWAAFTAWGHDSYNASSDINYWFWAVVAAIGILSLFILGRGKGR